MVTHIWVGNRYSRPPAIDGASIIETEPTYSVDLMKIELATRKPDLIYADFDVEPKDGFDEYFANLEPGMPHFGFYCGKPDLFLFAVNGCCDFFIKLLEEKRRQDKPSVMPWARQLMVLMGMKVIEIPKSIYFHRSDTHHYHERSR